MILPNQNVQNRLKMNGIKKSFFTYFNIIKTDNSTTVVHIRFQIFLLYM